MSEGQEPQRCRDSTRILNEWLREEHKIGYEAGGLKAEARVQELEEALKEQVEIAYRAGVEDGWENPDGNIENMTYEYMKYLEVK